MRPILDAQHASTLAGFAGANVLLAFDFDGTLAPLVDAPESAAMPPSTRSLLRDVASLYPVAILSGRGVADVSSKLEDVAVRNVIGNHGMEPGDGDDLESYAHSVRTMDPYLNAALEQAPGVTLENKRYSISMHYRGALEKATALALIERTIASLPVEVRVVHGKDVVNVIPVGAPDKGTALLALLASGDFARAIFVGDDITDEDVFRLDSPLVLGIRVGMQGTSAARFGIADQPEIDALLTRLVGLRRTSS